MNKTERMRKQQILGIVSMVYDIYEAQGRTPTSTEFFVALNHWQYFGKTPTLENITYGVSKCQIRYNNDVEVNLIKNVDEHNTCAICDAKITRSSTYCNNCDPLYI